MIQPVISIGIISCNHGAMIAKTIDSVLNQNLKYSFELIICDDNSTDNTNAIVEDFRLKNPGIITYIKSSKQLGPFLNGKQFFDLAKGKYLCWLDADDYWCFDKKLQTQIDFLEDNTEYAGCFHDAAIVHEPELLNSDSEQIKLQNKSMWKSYSQFNTYRTDFFPWDVLQRKIIPTASLVFKNKNFENFFLQHQNLGLSVSWALHLEIIKNSKFKYFNEQWSVYYDHRAGITKKSQQLNFNFSNIKILQNLLSDDYYRSIQKDIFQALSKEYFHILHSKQSKLMDGRVLKQYYRAYYTYTKKAAKAEIKAFKQEHKNNTNS